MSKVIIVGAGIIGLSSAYFLVKRGMEVVLIDKGVPGGACTSGNMGWVAPSLSEPVPAPGLVKTSLKWMLKKDSPLYIKPTAVPSLSSWLIQFWKFCNQESFKASFQAGLELNRKTLQLFDELEEAGEVHFESYRKGLLNLFLDESSIEKRIEELKPVQQIGVHEPEVKTRDELLKMEPTISEKVKGGVYLPAERHVRPESFSKGLHDWLMNNGVTILQDCEVTDFVVERGSITAVRADNELYEGDEFLVTAGAWVGLLMKKVGKNLPITAGKGYSVTISSPSFNIQQPVYLGDSKVAISPFKNAIRIGGTMELSGINTHFDERRLSNLRQSFNQYFRKPISGKEQKWVGMRPMTPDGLPVLGKLEGYENLYVATGHAMSGMAMSLSTGVIMSELISEGKTDIPIQPFAPGRFSLKGNKAGSGKETTVVS